METRQLMGDRRPPKRMKKRPLRRGAFRLLHRSGLSILFCLALVVLWFVAHLYYYNKLIDMEYDVQEAWAQVETQRQRRFHIQHNLARLVLAYSKHEREVLNALTGMRTGRSGSKAAQPRPAAAERPASNSKTAAAQRARARVKAALKEISPEKLDQLFPKIQLIAEQYPKLRLSENFQQFSRAIVTTETAIAEQVVRYNKTVNDYTTVLRQFPGNLFGRVCGFKMYDFFKPSRHKLKYRAVEVAGARGNG